MEGSVRVKLIVGLGNPGIEYQFTPHNAGFLAVDRIAEDCGVAVTNRRGRALTARARLAGRDVLLAKPTDPAYARRFRSNPRYGFDGDTGLPVSPYLRSVRALR